MTAGTCSHASRSCARPVTLSWGTPPGPPRMGCAPTNPASPSQARRGRLRRAPGLEATSGS
nr:K431 [uncultured bacterium]